MELLLLLVILNNMGVGIEQTDTFELSDEILLRVFFELLN
jgi:hypothetical protein